MDITRLIEQPESRTLEFKRDLSSLTPILKTIVAFANTAGGTLIIGRDSDGDLFGINDVFKAEERLSSTIADNIRPQILPEIEIVTIRGKNLLVIKVAHWKGPFYLKKDGIPKGVYIRLGSTSRLAGPDFVTELQRSAAQGTYDQQPAPDASIDSLDENQCGRLFQKIDKKIDQEKLQSLGVLVRSANRLVPSIGGLLLFGKEQEDMRIACARFAGNDKEVFLDRYEIKGTILDAIEEVPKFIARNTRLAAEIKQIKRRDIPEYSQIAIREALINALAHCDYSITGSRIQIAIFNDRLEIQNPGMFPFGFTLDDFKSGVSRIRNKVIARVFHELNFMEEWGSGYKRILAACQKEGYPEPKWEELGSAIRVVFYPHSQASVAHKKAGHPIGSRDLSDRQSAILKLFEISGESLSFQQIFAKLSPAVSMRTLRYDLAQLKEAGVLTPKGKARAQVWIRK